MAIDHPLDVQQEIDVLREDRVKLEARVAFLERCLKESTSRFEKEIGRLEKSILRSIKSAHDFEEALVRSSGRNSRQLEDAFARIANIEMKYFPNLGPDLDQLHKIIGDTGPQAECPEERRKP
jgi:hypothetical protein